VGIGAPRLALLSSPQTALAFAFADCGGKGSLSQGQGKGEGTARRRQTVIRHRLRGATQEDTTPKEHAHSSKYLFSVRGIRQ